MKRTLTWLAALSVVALVAAPALAQPGPHRHHCRGCGDEGFGPFAGHRLERLAMHLDLSDGQREQIHEELLAAREAGAETRRGLREARAALAETIHAEVFDETAIREAAAAVAALEAEVAVERARRAQSIRRILTPEQLEQLEELRRERPMRRHFGPRGRRFGPPEEVPGG